MAARKPVASAARNTTSRAAPAPAARRVQKAAPKPIPRATAPRATPVRRTIATRAPKTSQQETTLRPGIDAIEISRLRLDAFTIIMGKADCNQLSDAEHDNLMHRAGILADWSLGIVKDRPAEGPHAEDPETKAA
jgi:hypothetical protein